MFLQHPVFISSLFIIKTFFAELSKELHYLQTLKNQEKNPVGLWLSDKIRQNTTAKDDFLNKRCQNSQQIVKMCCPYLNTLVSGSPIIQNGKLVGAVTHVMINDPTVGYGIFIENMLNASASARNELPAA